MIDLFTKIRHALNLIKMTWQSTKSLIKYFDGSEPSKNFDLELDGVRIRYWSN